jgi:hypothetical protein
MLVGQNVALTGSATDGAGNPLPASALSWKVLLHHVDEVNPGNAHTHPHHDAAGVATTSFPMPAPEDLRATALSFLEVRLTAMDADGLTATVTRTIQPRRVEVTFRSLPAGVPLEVAGETFAAPRTAVLWAGWEVNLAAPELFTSSTGLVWTFKEWSDQGERSHTLVAPAEASTYTAVYTADLPFQRYLPATFGGP